MQVVDGGARYMEAVRPAYVMMEVNDGMMFGATGQTSAALFTRVGVALLVAALASCAG